MTEKDKMRFVMDEEYRRYYNRCLLFAKSYVYDVHEAGSIASDALLELWTRTEKKGEVIGQPIPFLFCVVRNKALDLMRAKYAKKRKGLILFSDELEELELRIESLESCDPHVLYSSDVQAIINDTLSSLGTKTREIFELSRYQGLTNAQIGQAMGIGVKSVEYHISKSLKAFRKALKDYLPFMASFFSL